MNKRHRKIKSIADELIKKSREAALAAVQFMAHKESFDTFSKWFRKNLKNALDEAGMSQRKQLLAGLDPRYIARIKKDEGSLTLMTIHRICIATGIDPESLFKK